MIREKFILNNAGVLVWEIAETLEELIGLLSNFNDYRTEYEQIKTKKRKLEFLCSRIALNNLSNKIVTVVYDSEGKPSLSENASQISISHSGKWVAVIAHPNRKVGIDIECPTDKFEKLYTRFLSQAEQIDIYEDKDLRKLQIAWSVKEALYKIIGQEAVDFAGRLKILPFEIEDNGTLKVEHLPAKTVYSVYYKISEPYNLAFCVD